MISQRRNCGLRAEVAANRCCNVGGRGSPQGQQVTIDRRFEPFKVTVVEGQESGAVQGALSCTSVKSGKNGPGSSRALVGQ